MTTCLSKWCQSETGPTARARNRAASSASPSSLPCVFPDAELSLTLTHPVFFFLSHPMTRRRPLATMQCAARTCSAPSMRCALCPCQRWRPLSRVTSRSPHHRTTDRKIARSHLCPISQTSLLASCLRQKLARPRAPTSCTNLLPARMRAVPPGTRLRLYRMASSIPRRLCRRWLGRAPCRARS